jgi:flagellar motility protein MotE (MotC chaperone)
MNPTLRVAMVAIFTTIGTSYFLAGGLFNLMRTARSAPLAPTSPAITPDFLGPLSRPVSTTLALKSGVGKNEVKPLKSDLEAIETKWRYAELERESMKTQMEVHVKTLMRMEGEIKSTTQIAEGYENRMMETQRLIQEASNALEAAQIRIGKMESAVKNAEEVERQATLSTKKMVKLFVTMPPENAAKILQELPNKETADLLARMKEAEAGAILVLFPPKRAAALSARLAGNRGGPP